MDARNACPPPSSEVYRGRRVGGIIPLQVPDRHLTVGSLGETVSAELRPFFYLNPECAG